MAEEISSNHDGNCHLIRLFLYLLFASFLLKNFMFPFQGRATALEGISSCSCHGNGTSTEIEAGGHKDQEFDSYVTGK